LQELSPNLAEIVDCLTSPKIMPRVPNPQLQLVIATT